MLPQQLGRVMVEEDAALPGPRLGLRLAKLPVELDDGPLHGEHGALPFLAGRRVAVRLVQLAVRPAEPAQLAPAAAEREAHAREVEQTIQTFPAGSHGRANRRAITARETRISARLRAIEHAYQRALGFQGAPSLKLPDITSPATRAPDREPELE